MIVDEACCGLGLGLRPGFGVGGGRRRRGGVGGAGAAGAANPPSCAAYFSGAVARAGPRGQRFGQERWSTSEDRGVALLVDRDDFEIERRRRGPDGRARPARRAWRPERRAARRAGAAAGAGAGAFATGTAASCFRASSSFEIASEAARPAADVSVSKPHLRCFSSASCSNRGARP